ncbi:LPXTG cell wall anchor domain-containing protein [Actinoplanes sp. NPDC051346]|uniref:LPXTG cell wall anchor domain-containing protein n=1 Tax=Actinoplanes sp. NPDC051346 TaxID=3155048 RepID=UPI00342C6712
MTRIPAAWARVGAGVAVLAATTLIGAPTVAHAADPLPDLSVAFDRDPVAEVDNSGATVGVYAFNNGEAPASAVTLTLDLSKLSDAVVATVPEWSEQCKLANAKVTCTVGGLAPGQSHDSIAALSLASRTGAAVGAAGEIAVTIDGAEDDANPNDDTTTFPVTVIASGPDLVVDAQDATTEKTPVGPGDKVPFHGGVSNEGDTAATNGTVTLNLPIHATVVERYSDCTYQDYFPKDIGGEYVYGPSEVTCPLPKLEPGEGLLLFDPESGDSVFTLTFGRNMPGPGEHDGVFEARLADETRAAKGAKRVAGDGPSFAAAVKKLAAKSTASRSAQAKRNAALAEIDEEDNYAYFRYWSKKNTLDVQVNAKPIRGKVGQTVKLSYEIVNQGPSDGGGPSALITAPSGTVLLPTEWCYTDGTPHEQRPESKKLRCNFESEYPSVASGYGKIAHTVKVKIKSAPGDDGTIHAESCCVGSTDSNKANNTARIVFAGADGGNDQGGAGGGASLPITGTSVSLIAATGGAAVVLGIAVMVLFRRRRVAD